VFDTATAADDTATTEHEAVFIVYRQQKYGINQGLPTVAVLGGLKDDREDAARGLAGTASRELLEELGMVPRRMVPFGEHRVDGNRGCGTIATFLALDCDLDPGYVRPCRPRARGHRGLGRARSCVCERGGDINQRPTWGRWSCTVTQTPSTRFGIQDR
jgi:hypothetical protein